MTLPPFTSLLQLVNDWIETGALSRSNTRSTVIKETIFTCTTFDTTSDLLTTNTQIVTLFVAVSNTFIFHVVGTWVWGGGLGWSCWLICCSWRKNVVFRLTVIDSLGGSEVFPTVFPIFTWFRCIKQEGIGI